LLDQHDSGIMKVTQQPLIDLRDSMARRQAGAHRANEDDMTIIRRSAGLGAILLSVLGLLLCIAGVAGLGLGKGRLDIVIAALLEQPTTHSSSWTPDSIA
jgi:hypothetical protein